MRRFAVLGTATLLLASCQAQGVHLIPTSELPEDVYGRPADPVPIEGQEIPEAGTVFLVDKGLLTEVRRELPPAVSLPQALVEALLEVENPVGNTDLYSAVPRNTRLLSIEVDQNVATVNLSGEFESGATGEPLALRLAQVVYTLTQKETEILNVLFSIEGEPVGVLTGNGVVVERPVTREDYARFAPSPPKRPGSEASPSPGDGSD
ncbi:MAG: GerMN domain-containing protein [Actinomycetota bacterium]